MVTSTALLGLESWAGCKTERKLSISIHHSLLSAWGSHAFSSMINCTSNNESKETLSEVAFARDFVTEAKMWLILRHWHPQSFKHLSLAPTALRMGSPVLRMLFPVNPLWEALQGHTPRCISQAFPNPAELTIEVVSESEQGGLGFHFWN